MAKLSSFDLRARTTLKTIKTIAPGFQLIISFLPRLLHHFIGSKIKPLRSQFLLVGSEKTCSMPKGSVVFPIMRVGISISVFFLGTPQVLRATGFNGTEIIDIWGVRKVFFCSKSEAGKVIQGLVFYLRSEGVGE